MLLLLLLAMHNHQMDAKHHHPAHHPKVVCHTYATSGPFKGVKDCK